MIGHERNIVNGAISVALSGAMEFITPIRWLALFGLFLIVTDLRFGIKAARQRGETIRFSRAGRRSLNKITDYICLLLLTASLEKVFLPLDIPLLPAIVILVIYGFEISSIISNYFEGKGKSVKVKFNFLSLIGKQNLIEITEDSNETKENSVENKNKANGKVSPPPLKSQY